MDNSSIYTNTGITEKSWNSRGLITHSVNTKTLVRLDKNTLYAAVRENDKEEYIKIKLSTDNGFSWTTVYADSESVSGATPWFISDVPGQKFAGPIMHMEALKLNLDDSRQERYLVFAHGYERYDLIIGPTSSIQSVGFRAGMYLFKIRDDLSLKLETPLLIPFGVDSPSCALSATDSTIYLSGVLNGQLKTNAYQAVPLEVYPAGSKLSQALDGSNTTTQSDYQDLLATSANEKETLDILLIKDRGNFRELVYRQFDKLASQHKPEVVIKTNVTNLLRDLNICRDGYGNVLAYWSEITPNFQTAREFYSLSLDDGNTWSAPVILPISSSQSNFFDDPLNSVSSRAVVVQGSKGFVLGYTRVVGGKSSGFVRPLLSANGTSYSLQPEKIAVSHPTRNIAGFKFFLPAANALVNTDNLGDIRIAFQLDKSTKIGQVDNHPAYFGQKLLSDEAYPEDVPQDREIDSPLPNQMLASFNLLPGITSNIDYYAEGLVGEFTHRYISVMNQKGISIRLKRYEPTIESTSDDKSAYTLEEDFYASVFIEDINYAFPINMSSESFEEFISRDTRQMHIPPNIHISRKFIINNGNKLKRTVWIAEFGGNEYELTQVVPNFVMNQITHYKTNAYVVGPFNDPFSRLIAPSET